MRSIKVALFAGAAIAAAVTTTQAADLPPIVAPRAVMPVQVDDFTSGWYLRGDIGVGVQHFSDFAHHQTNPNFVWPASWRIDQRDINDTAFVGIGVGYVWNSWLRFDATAEYRNSSRFKVVGSYTEFCPNGGRCFDVYDAHHQASVFMANAYLDLGTWWCLTPFVGVGLGTAHHSIRAFTDVGYIADGTSAFGFASTDQSIWKPAWALHAGVAYNVNSNFKVELAYRYLNMGNVDTQVLGCASQGCATNGPRAFYTLNNFDSHDFKLGVRWMLQPEQAPAPAFMPLVRKG